ncbi:MAG: transposase, partial [Candidatus Cloacimonetes bacterium]|nr:transposase [Candidatus Cloacimonadota bacterium]
LSDELQTELFEKNRLLLNTPMRSNQKRFRKQPAVFRKVRKRIETIFSQLCDQFMIRRNYAKTFIGFATRIISKITAFTLLQYINKFITNRPLNHVKHALI